MPDADAIIKQFDQKEQSQGQSRSQAQALNHEGSTFS